MSLVNKFKTKSLQNLLFSLCLVLLPIQAQSLENQLTITQEHFTNLGVTVGKPIEIQQIPILYAPAKVVIPSAHEHIVSTAQGGLISQLSASIGDSVKKGQVLAVINSPELLNLQTQFLNTKTALHLAANTYARDQKLLAEGVIADRRAQETISQYSYAQLNANQAKQMLEISGMTSSDIDQLSKTQKLTSQLNVRSPVAGIVLDRMAVVGTRVDNQAPLYRVGKLDELWLELNIPQEHLTRIKLGDLVILENESVQAKISLLGQNVNPENQTVLARALIQGKSANVRPGQKLNTQVVQVADTPVYKLANSAIAQNEGKAFIFIRNQQGFQVTPVTVVGKQGEESIVSGAITGADAIALTGAVALKATWLGLGAE